MAVNVHSTKPLVVLKGITWDHTRGFDPMPATVAAYREEHPEVFIHWDKRSLHDFGHAPVQELAKSYDLIVLDHPWAGFIAATECCIALDQYMPPATMNALAQNTVGPSHRSYAWAGHQWALAIDAATPSAWYRPDLLEKLQVPVPKNWDDLLRLGREARQAGWHMAMPLNAVDAITTFLTLADNIDGKPFAENTDRIVSDEVGRQVLNAMRQLLEFGDPSDFELTPIKLGDSMGTRDEIVYCPMAYSYNNYARFGYRSKLVRFGNIPALGTHGPRGSHIGGTGLAVSSRCQHREIAADYASRVAGGDWQKTIYFQAGGQPGHAAAWEDAAVNQSASNFFKDTRETIERAFLRPRYNGYIPFQYAGGALIRDHLRNRSSDDLGLLRDLDQLYVSSKASH